MICYAERMEKKEKWRLGVKMMEKNGNCRNEDECEVKIKVFCNTERMEKKGKWRL